MLPDQSGASRTVQVLLAFPPARRLGREQHLVRAPRQQVGDGHGHVEAVAQYVDRFVDGRGCRDLAVDLLPMGNERDAFAVEEPLEASNAASAKPETIRATQCDLDRRAFHMLGSVVCDSLDLLVGFQADALGGREPLGHPAKKRLAFGTPFFGSGGCAAGCDKGRGRRDDEGCLE
jgi:hypothetical protein